MNTEVSFPPFLVRQEYERNWVLYRQTDRISQRLSSVGIELASSRDPERRGGFVAARVPQALAAVEALRAEGVHTDSRGELLRLGPAPYLSDAEIERGLDAVVRVLAAGRARA